MNSIKQIKFWSNMFFLIPLALAIAYQVWWYSVILGVVFVISSYFHFHHEKKLIVIDMAASTVLMLSNFILLFQGRWALPYSLMAVACAVIAIFFYWRQFKGNYNLNHGLWHIFSSGVCYFCVATYLMFIGLF